MQPFTVLEGIVAPLEALNVDTDQIIPKQFLKRVERTGYGQYLFCDWRYLADGKTLNPNFELNAPRYQGATILLSKDNFGCGSSREHAPWALEVNGINLVIAENFARIFRQNMYNCGMMAVELPADVIDSLFDKFSNKNTVLETDFEKSVFVLTSGDLKVEIPFSVSEFDMELVRSGGWVNYADRRY